MVESRIISNFFGRALIHALLVPPHTSGISPRTTPHIRWQIDIAIYSPSIELTDETLTFTIRIALGQEGIAYRLAPSEFEFSAPAIVRTLLREHVARDASVRVVPEYRVRRADDVPALFGHLLSQERRLPVVVVTGNRGRQLFDAGELARQLAGLAHVEVLPSSLASWQLTNLLGRDLSVWGGATRLYWPGFNVSDSPSMHRYWTAERLSRERSYVTNLRTWLGTLSAASVPENQAVALQRDATRSSRPADGELPQWAEAYVESVERDAAEARSGLTEARADATLALSENERLRAELDDLRDQFRVFNEHTRGSDADEDAIDLDALSIEDAYQLAVAEAGDHVAYLPSVDRSIRDFSTYNLPRRLYEALTSVADAARLWATGELVGGFGTFFAEKGYEYSAHNPAARARPTRASYQRTYRGERLSMEPHLKVDQSTSPDQCLRVYWLFDESEKIIVIGHVGRHLPD